MISRKQHNDLIEKLLKQITGKQNQVEQLKKQLKKAPNQIPQLEKTQNQQILNKKINQLNKEYKERITTLNQQLRSRSNEVKDLKQRLNLQKNIQAKEKSHVAELYKKNFDRKPSTPHDFKVAALINHYQEELNKKNNIIKNLRKQIQDHPQIQTQNYESQHNVNIYSLQQTKHQGIDLVKHQSQINKIQNEVNKYKRMYEQKTKQHKDMFRKYEQLTKEYYCILNEYNCQPKNIAKNFKETKNNYMNNLLAQACESQQEKQPQPSQLSYQFQTNLNKFKSNQNLNSAIQSHITNAQQQQLIQRIKQLIKVQSDDQIIPYLLKIQSKLSNLQIYDQVAKSVQQLLIKMGMGKIPLSQISSKVRLATTKYEQSIQGLDLLDEICIQAGAKRNQLIEKIKDLKGIQEQYFKNMKNMKFVKQLPKANKVAEFIEYFSLTEEQIELPEQLRQIYQQLKYLNKFMKQADIILDRQTTSIQNNLEGILRILQQYRNSDTYAQLSHINAKKTLKIPKKSDIN